MSTQQDAAAVIRACIDIDLQMLANLGSLEQCSSFLENDCLVPAVAAPLLRARVAYLSAPAKAYGGQTFVE